MTLHSIQQRLPEYSEEGKHCIIFIAHSVYWNVRTAFSRPALLHDCDGESRDTCSMEFSPNRKQQVERLNLC